MPSPDASLSKWRGSYYFDQPYAQLEDDCKSDRSIRCDNAKGSGSEKVTVLLDPHLSDGMARVTAVGIAALLAVRRRAADAPVRNELMDFPFCRAISELGH